MIDQLGDRLPPRIEAVQPPGDSISDLRWLPINAESELLACTAWDGTARVWQVNIMGQQVQTIAKALYNTDAPLLSCDFSKNNGGCLFSGGCDRMLRIHNLQTAQTMTVGQHDQPIFSVHACDAKGVVVTGSWDKTIRVWDTRTPTAAFTYHISNKLTAVDFKYPILSVAKADRGIDLYNFDALNQNPAISSPSALRAQIRCMSLFEDKKGYSLGSIEGRCSVVYVEESQKSKSFPFKCHRIEDRRGVLCHSINSVDCNSYGTFATAGSDGVITGWDKDHRQRLRCIDQLGHPVTKIKFNAAASLLAYSLSYDWHKGHGFSDPTKSVNKVLIQPTTADMVKLKPPQRPAGPARR